MGKIEKRWSLRLLALTFGLVALLAPAAAAQQEQEEEGEAAAPQDRPVLRAHPLTSVIRLDGVLSEEDWEDAESIGGLVTIEPEEGGTPAGRTEVKILVSSGELIIGLACYDDDPSGIVAYSMARDIELDEEDHVVLVFDTFRDGRSGYVFAINPEGSRFDGLIVEQGEDVNSNWDAIWEAATTRDDEGWYAEIRIPINSLGFRQGLDAWGLNVERRVQRLQETSRWSGVDIDFEIYQTSQAGLLTELPDFDFGRGLTIRPSFVGRTGTPEPDADRESDVDYAFDINQKLGSNLLAGVTVNTDFAETEVDVRQINLTRFPLYFQEKRSFFLEGADIFEFGLGLDEENLVPFNSRRIGLVGLGEGDQLEVPINAGGKINGRMGNTNVGALVVNTRGVDEIELEGGETIALQRTTMGAVRLSQNILDESSVGMLATFGDQAGRADSWTAGADFNYHTSEFGDEKNLLVGLWGMLAGREDLEGDKTAVGLRIDYPNDLFDFTFNSIRVGDGFDPSLSFVPRDGVHIWSFSGGYNPRPSWSLVRQMTHEIDVQVYNQQDNSEWESYAAEIIPLDWQLESGDQFSANLIFEGDRPPEEFEIADDVNVAEGEYKWTRYGFDFRGAEKRAFSGELRYEWGDYYNGNLKTVEASVIFRPSALLTLEISTERSTGEAQVIEGTETLTADFAEKVYGFRVLLNLSPNLQFGTLTQYDTESRELGSNNKLRWTFSPNGDLFVVYNHNLLRTITPRQWNFESNQIPVKIQYSWRF